ncbi:hypothetical protein C8R45DRAFT_972030 [Mycena sanguinolenta]|nr:hypothetical protein C8R45DRAFT_972030 [Mycena sanguinolenta]
MSSPPTMSPPSLIDNTFPNHGFRFLSACVHFLGVTLITYFLSRRLSVENLTSRAAWANITWPRICILLILLDSYLFILAGGLLIFGVGLRRNGHSCSAAIYLCVLFYTSSKILIYAFLTEKVYIVWENGARRRLKSPVYLICMGTIVLYLGIILAMFFERIAAFRSGDSACVIGLKPMASLPLLSYDLYINVLLTSLFVWPLLRLKFANPRLRRVATCTLVASIAALTTSTVNIGILTILHGRELAWVCLASCGADVVLNAVALFWVTSGRTAPASATNSLTGREGSPDGSPSSSRRRSQLKPFRLQPKSVVAKPPTQFEIHVTTSSESETSPAYPHIELPPETSIEQKAEPFEEPKIQPIEQGTQDETLLLVDESKRHSAADSEKTLRV